MAENEIEVEINPLTIVAVAVPAAVLLIYASAFLLSAPSLLWIVVIGAVFALSAFSVYVLFKADRLNLMFAVLLLEIVAFVFLYEVRVTLYSPIAFGDEGYHTQLAKIIAKNVDYYVWMPFEGSKVEDQSFSRPPLWNVLEASFYYLFGFHPTIIEILNPLIAVLTGIAAFALFRKVFSPSIGFFSAVVAITLPSIVTYANLFYVDTLLVFWVTLFLGTFLLAEKNDNKKYLVASAVFAAFAVLTKTTGFALFFFYFVYFVYEIFKTKNFSQIIKKYILIFAVLAVFLGGFALRNLYYYGTPVCGLPVDVPFFNQHCTISSNYTPRFKFTGSTAQTGTDQNVYSLGIISYLTFTYGVIWFVPLALFIGMVMVANRREKMGIVVFAFLIAMLPIFYLTFKNRAEDAARYTMIAVPAVSLIVGNYLDGLSEILSKYKKFLLLFFVMSVVVISLFNFYVKSAAMFSVKQFSPLFFQACDWVKANLPQDATLLSVYGHPTVYNCNRNAVWVLQDLPDIVLSNNMTLVMNRLKTDGIDYIFVQKFALSTQAYSQNFPLSFVEFMLSNPNQFVPIYENGPDLNTCLSQGGCDGSMIFHVNSTVA